MNVLFVSAEAAPFAKVGGMADVVGSLPAALRRMGIDARVLLPGYGFIPHDRYNIRFLRHFQVPTRSGTADVRMYITEYEGVPVYFLQAWPYFGDEGTVYTEFEWDGGRFVFFNQIVMGAAWELSQRDGWTADVYHVNDWHTGLLPFLIQENRFQPVWEHAATVLSIHNLKYQGSHSGGWLWLAGIPGRHQPDLVYQGLTDNILAIAIAYSDIVTTVSPRYAIEIQYPYMGYGLDGLIHTRLTDLYGILNGIDGALWNPETDSKIAVNYNAETFEEKRHYNKFQLQRDMGLDVRQDALLIGVVSRLVWQKGFDLALPALRQFLAENDDVHFVLLGTGEPGLEDAFRQLEEDFGWKARCILQYDGAVAQQIYAGCDLFLMPSHFEPCGMGQMIAMRYGALPLVRETGGLADTVVNYDNDDGIQGTGFVFAWEQPEAVLGTLRWALDTWRHRRHAWRRMQHRGMTEDFSWDKSASKYTELYRKALNKKKG